MRKITLLLALCLSVIGLRAQTTILNGSVQVSGAPVDGEWSEGSKFYTIKNKNGNYINGDVKVSDTNYLLLNSNSKPGDNAVWCVVGDETSGYSFYNYGTKQVLTMSPETAAEANSYAWLEDASTAVGDNERCFEFVESAADGYWCIKVKGSEMTYLAQHGAQGQRLAYWKNNQAVWGWGASSFESGSGDDGCAFVFEEVDVNAIIVNVTYVYRINGKEYTRATVEQVANSEVAAPAQKYLNIESCDGTVGEEDCEVVVNCTEDLPFVVSADINNPIWQVVEMHRYDSFRVWEYVGVDQAVKVTEVAEKEILANNDAMYWCFTGNLVDGFKIYNKQAGTTYTLNATASNPKMGTATNNNDIWKLKASTATNSPAACFTNDGNNCMNRSGQGVIGYYGQADNGSTCYFYQNEAVSGFVVEAYNILNAIPEGAVGSYIISEEQASTLASAKAAYDANTTDFTKTQALATAIVNVKADAEKVTFKDGYYHVFSALPGLYAKSKGLLYEASNITNPFRWGTISSTNVEAIVKMTLEDGKYRIQSVNTKNYMNHATGSFNATSTDKEYVTLGELGNAQYNINFVTITNETSTDPEIGDEVTKEKTTTTTMHANGHGNGGGSNGNVINYPGTANSASAWYLIPATELDINMVAAQGGAYTSIYLPFAVTLDKGTNAYAGEVSVSNEKYVLNMTKLGNVVPAETPVVLVSDNAGAHTLTIGGTADAVADNDLAGTLTPIVFADNKLDYLIFGIASEKAGFYTSAGTQISANKAYLLASRVAAAQTVKMNFGGEATGIEAIEKADNAKAPIYDLSGRRVVNTAKGGIYIQNGRKFIVK